MKLTAALLVFGFSAIAVYLFLPKAGYESLAVRAPPDPTVTMVGESAGIRETIVTHQVMDAFIRHVKGEVLDEELHTVDGLVEFRQQRRWVEGRGPAEMTLQARVANDGGLQILQARAHIVNEALVRPNSETSVAMITEKLAQIEAKVVKHVPGGFLLIEWPEGGRDLEQVRHFVDMFVPEIDLIESNGLVFTASLPTDTEYGSQWGHEDAGYGAAVRTGWETLDVHNAPIVAVLDSGIDSDHADLAASIMTVDEGTIIDFVDDDHLPEDENGHGTHVAGIIGAQVDNDLGIAGVAKSVRLLPIRILDANGAATYDRAIAGIAAVAPLGGKVMNNSWIGFSPSEAMREALGKAVDDGIVIVNAAGNFFNDNDLYPMYPACYVVDRTISVAALDATEGLIKWSNRGWNTVDLGAPGGDIISCYLDNDYRVLSGTSMAAPYVAGGLAALMAHRPDLDALVIQEMVLQGSRTVVELEEYVMNGRVLRLDSIASSAGSYSPSVRTVTISTGGQVWSWEVTEGKQAQPLQTGTEGHNGVGFTDLTRSMSYIMKPILGVSG